MQLVMAAITTRPWSSEVSVPSARVRSTLLDTGGAVSHATSRTGTGGAVSSAVPEGGSLAGKLAATSLSSAVSTWTSESPSTPASAALARSRGMRSWGRLGPASDGTTVDMSSSTTESYCGSFSGSCQRPWVLA